MSRSMQDVIMARLAERLDAAGYTYTVDTDWSNTGTIRVLHPDTLEALAALRYDFQQSRVRFSEVGSADAYAFHFYDEPRRPGEHPSVKGTPGELVDAVVAYLTGGAA